MSTIADETDAIDAQPRGRNRRQLARADLSNIGNPEVVKVVGLILGSPEFQRQ
jgi:hypothetical protein